MVVPTAHLRVDPATAGNLGKYTPEQMRTWMSCVPQIYAMRTAGVSDRQFQRMAQDLSDERNRVLGETYRHLFSTSPSAQPLRASFHEAHGLMIDAGQHRVQAARDAGVTFLPVHVSAATAGQLMRLRDAFERDLRVLAPDLPDLVEVQRAHDAQHYPERSAIRLHGDMHQGRERLEPERETGWRFPEREG